MDVSVVIPTYNERDNIAELLEAVSDALSGSDHEILVVDDASPDGTADAARAVQDDVPVRVMERDRKRGLGSAYKDGFRAVDGDVVVQMDADFSHPPERIPALVEAVEGGADVAVGSRYVAEGERHDPIYRRIFPLIGSYLYRGLLRSPVRDVTSGFKAYRRGALETLPDELPDGFHFQAASLFALIEDGAVVVEVPITFRERKAGRPKYTTRDLLDNVWLLAKLSVRHNARLLRFAAVGSTGIVVDMALLYALTEFAALYYLFSAVIATETAILSNFVLNDLWTFHDRGGTGAQAALERLTKYHVVSLGGMTIKLAALWALTEYGGLYYLLSNLAAIGVAFTWNYLVNVLWTWQEI